MHYSLERTTRFIQYRNSIEPRQKLQSSALELICDYYECLVRESNFYDIQPCLSNKGDDRKAILSRESYIQQCRPL